MARGFFINGPLMVYVKGNVQSGFPTLTELGLSVDQVSVIPQLNYDDCYVESWGKVPNDKQYMGATARVAMTLVHFDQAVLRGVINESMAGGLHAGVAFEGFQPITGHLMGGGGLARFAAGNHYIGLNLSSPVGALPWRFLYAHLSSTTPISWPLGAARSQVTISFDIVPYATDPYGAGGGFLGVPLWDHTLDV